ncbi:GCN5 family acetyltransferase [Devosia sp. Root436]|jgi:GNAT superfamily N-acetyltransferase|uniref:GNAT family N-acetyltransferase n=1 Tax=Devosia sp. Root436 TaxID=1736537 RepID=UPI0006FF43D3|nr:GNAT family N-acetyltransferase [Devosia sp. Root436]KQX38585.1 GCN5 family acetyltransferase [Devosia sp. Root436]
MSNAMHWRALTTLDLPDVETIAAKVHPSFPEDMTVFAERQRLYPDGTLLLELDGVPAGYIISHPWRLGAIPALNALLGAIPDDADTYYLHDLALLPAARGTGAAAMIVGEMLRHAKARGFPSISLVAVNGSLSFWYKHGFRAVAAPELAEKLASYEATARYMVRRLV